jgi:ABC-2 type transport system permease protein
MATTLQLTTLHARYSLLETVRVPIAVIGSLVFPALSLLFFVVPQAQVAGDPRIATQAVISLIVFAVLANSLFGFGLTIAQAREQAWDPYLRTLPVTGVARVLSHLCSVGLLGFAAVVPVVMLGALLTAATATPTGLLGGVVALVVGAMPFMLLGTAIGYALPSKAAIAVVQVAMFSLAFAGGLFIPPFLFAPWLDRLSMFLPSRQTRELVVWAVQGGELPWWSWVGVLTWTLVLTVVVLALYRRDEGRRYR